MLLAALALSAAPQSSGDSPLALARSRCVAVSNSGQTIRFDLAIGDGKATAWPVKGSAWPSALVAADESLRLTPFSSQFASTDPDVSSLVVQTYDSEGGPRARTTLFDSRALPVAVGYCGNSFADAAANVPERTQSSERLDVAMDSAGVCQVISEHLHRSVVQVRFRDDAHMLIQPLDARIWPQKPFPVLRISVPSERVPGMLWDVGFLSEPEASERISGSHQAYQAEDGSIAMTYLFYEKGEFESAMGVCGVIPPDQTGAGE